MSNTLTKEALQSLRDEARNHLSSLLPDAVEKLEQALHLSTKPDEVQKLATLIFDYAGLAPPREQPKTEQYIALEALREAMRAMNSIASGSSITSNQGKDLGPSDERNVTPPITSLAEAKRFYSEADEGSNGGGANAANGGSEGNNTGGGSPADEPTADLTYLEELE